uniref:Secreted protein n=1 Tax=Ixodes ricinus TaxID=34613 RepID=A0A6B0UAH2_IXORI
MPLPCPLFLFVFALAIFSLSLSPSISLSFSMGGNVSCAIFAPKATVASHQDIRLVAVFVVWERKQKNVSSRFLLLWRGYWGLISLYFCRISWRHVLQMLQASTYETMH